MKLRRLSTGFLVLALLVTGCEPPARPGHRTGDIAPDIAGKTADEKLVSLSDYRGKVVLVLFWGTWCGPCRQQLPTEIEKVTKTYRNRPFAMLGVAQDPPEKMKAFLASNNLPWENICDSGSISREWDVNFVPSYLIIGPDSVIKHAWFNGANPKKVWEEVEDAVSELERKAQ